MNDKDVSGVHWSFWVIGTFMLLWNVMGCINFIVQMNPDMVASYRDSEQSIILGRPAWATVAFAIAVFSGALGCLLLMLKKSVKNLPRPPDDTTSTSIPIPKITTRKRRKCC